MNDQSRKREYSVMADEIEPGKSGVYFSGSGP